MGDGTRCNSSAISGAVGQASCGIVHDLANLLQTVLLRAEVTAATEDVSPACAKRLEQIVEDSKRCADIVRSLLERARIEVDLLPKVDLAPVARDAAEALRAAWGQAASVEARLPVEAMPVRADAAQVGDLIAILGAQLLRGAKAGATLRLSLLPASEAGEALADSLWMEEREWALLTLERLGAGTTPDYEGGLLPEMDANLRMDEQTFEMLRVKGIVRQHRGQLHAVESVDDDGQSCIVRFFWPGL